MRAPLYGLLSGILLDVLLWFTGPLNESLLKFLTGLSTPVAYIISWITGWKFQQEESIMIYMLAIPISIALVGMLCGLFYSGVKVALNRRRKAE